MMPYVLLRNGNAKLAGQDFSVPRSSAVARSSTCARYVLDVGLILILTICFAVAKGAYLVKGDHAMAVVYSGYAWPNVGLLWLDHMRR